MAESNKLNCRIIKIQSDPRAPGRKIVSLEIEHPDGNYVRAFSLVPPERPISVEELAEYLADKDLSRPVDPFVFLEEAKQNKTVFEIALTDKKQQNA